MPPKVPTLHHCQCTERAGPQPRRRALLRLVIKPLGDYPHLHQRLRAGQRVDIEGPYGRFDGQGSRRRQQVWVAAGVGVTFFALLEHASPAGPRGRDPAPYICITARDARRDPLLARLQSAVRASPAARAAHRARHQDLQARASAWTPQASQATKPNPVARWTSGSAAPGPGRRAASLRAHAARPQPLALHRESFVMR